MRRWILAVLGTVIFAASAPQMTAGQVAESALQHVAEVNVKPRLIQQFEAGHAVRNQRMASADVSFAVRASVSESLVYRFVTPVGDMDGLQRRSSEMSNWAPAPAGSPNGNAAIDHVDSYLRWTRPDLGYTPANPRLANSEWQAIQRFRIFVAQGKMNEMADVLRDVAALYKAHDIREGYQVFVQGLGADGPIVEIQVFGASLADIYETGERLDEQIGAQMNQIRTRVGALSRRVELDNFQIRRDLGYQAGN